MLNILIDEGRFIVGPERLDSPLELPPFFFGDVKPLGLRAFKKGASGVYAVDLSSYQTTLWLGPSNARPALGFWQLTTTLGTSAAIAARAQDSDIVIALRSAFAAPDVDVKGSQGSYIITLGQVGIQVLPTATFQGNTLSDVLVFEISPGTASTPAQYRVEVLEVAPARIVPAHWSAGVTVPANTFVQASGKLWQLILDPEVNAGFFSLTVDGQTTALLSWLSSAYEIAVALSAIGKPGSVQVNGTGGFLVSFVSNVAVATVGGYLVIQPFQTGSLALNTTGVRELLDGLQFAPVKLSVLIVKDGQTITAASADVILQMPINQPATIVIDSPQMAGLTFAISNDQAYLQVYQNGIHSYDIPLNNPSGPGNLNVYEDGFLSFSIPLNTP